MAENVPEKDRLVDLDPWLQQLKALDWSTGLTREQLRELLADFPHAVYMLLPSEREFRSPDELTAYYHRAWQRSQSEGIPATGAEEDGGPSAWGTFSPATGERSAGAQ